MLYSIRSTNGFHTKKLNKSLFKNIPGFFTNFYIFKFVTSLNKGFCLFWILLDIVNLLYVHSTYLLCRLHENLVRIQLSLCRLDLDRPKHIEVWVESESTVMDLLLKVFSFKGSASEFQKGV